jgi:hypothetical protein
LEARTEEKAVSANRIFQGLRERELRGTPVIEGQRSHRRRVAQLGDAGSALANTTVFRIYHSTSGEFPGEALAASIGVDNIQAVPEPASTALMLAGLGVVAAVARRRSRS